MGVVQRKKREGRGRKLEFSPGETHCFSVLTANKTADRAAFRSLTCMSCDSGSCHNLRTHTYHAERCARNPPSRVPSWGVGAFGSRGGRTKADAASKRAGFVHQMGGYPPAVRRAPPTVHSSQFIGPKWPDTQPPVPRQPFAAPPLACCLLA